MASSNSDVSETTKNQLIAAGLMSIFGLLGNVLVIVLIFREKEKKSTTSYLLLSLAVADIVNLLCIDLFAMLIHVVPKHSQNTQKIVFITFPAKIVANFTLALIAFERYNALVKTMRPFAILTKRRIIIGAFASWLVGTAFSVPIVLQEYCNAHGRRTDNPKTFFFWALFFIGYTMPLIVVVFCYSSILKGLYIDGTILGRTDIRTDVAARVKEKTRLVRILVVITLVFLACNAPVVIILVMQNFAYNGGHKDVLDWIQLILGCYSSVLNPYLYGLHSEKHRRELKMLFCIEKENTEDETEMTASVCDAKL